MKDYPPINKVQSKFIVKKEILKDQKGKTSLKLKVEKDKSVVAKLKTAGCYTLGVFTAIGTPYYFFAGGVSKLIGLPFNENSFINRLGNTLIETPKITPKLFKEIPENMNEKITGLETHYDIYDVEKIYWSDESITQKIFNVRHQIISN